MKNLKAALAVTLVAFLGGTVSSFVLAAPAAATEEAAPAVITGEHPGLSSVTVTPDHTWTLTIESDSLSELKVITPYNSVICSEDDAGNSKNGHIACEGLVYSFGASPDCIAVQLDWHGGAFNSSDPVLCVPDTTTPPTEEPPVTEEPPYVPPVVHCEPPYAPGILDDHGNPTSCVNNGPMPPITCPEGEVKDSEGFCYTPQPPCPEGTTPVYIDDNPNGYIDHCEAVVVPPTVTPTPTPEPTPAVVPAVVDDQGSPPQLAETGFSPGYFGGAAVAFIVAGLLVFFVPKRKH